VNPDEDGSSGMTGPYKKIWVGINVAQDFAFVGGDNVCTAESQANDNFACYYPNSTDVPYDPNHFGTKAVGAIGTGSVAATTRFLLSVDYAFTANITAGARIGYAIRGGPPAGRQVTYTQTDTVASVVREGTPFLPFHAEVRGTYWFGRNALARRGFRPYVAAGGGLAQVDAKVVVNTHEERTDGGQSGDFSADAWKKLGQGFVTLSGGVGYAFTPKTVAQLNLNAMYMLGASGLVLQPSLGLVLGF
jgi:hypothetical protein